MAMAPVLLSARASVSNNLSLSLPIYHCTPHVSIPYNKFNSMCFVFFVSFFFLHSDNFYLPTPAEVDHNNRQDNLCPRLLLVAQQVVQSTHNTTSTTKTNNQTSSITHRFDTIAARIAAHSCLTFCAQHTVLTWHWRRGC